MSKKVTFATVRRLAAGLPGVETGTSYGASALKLNGKLMTCIATNKSAEPNSLVLRIDFDQRDALIAEAPETYYITPHYVNYPSVLVRLSQVTPEALKDLLRASWRFISAGNVPKPARKRQHRGI